MKTAIAFVFAGLLTCSAFGQAKQIRHERRPAALPDAAVLNSDGNFEPEGLQIFNFYTANSVDPNTAPNSHNARDCKIWNALVSKEMAIRPPNAPTWSYIEFTVAQGARMIQTNEDGYVWWSDDIECWGSRDRFPPF